MKKIIPILFVGALIAMGRYAGQIEHAENVALTIPQEQYDEIAETIGTNDIVKVVAYYERNL